MIVVHTRYSIFNKDNFLFTNSEAPIGDGLLLPYVRLYEELSNLGIKAITSNDNPALLGSATAVLFLDLPNENDGFFSSAKLSKVPLYLITLESPIILPSNFDPLKHGVFTKVFTWDDELVLLNRIKYVKIHYSYDFPDSWDWSGEKRMKRFVQISGNKSDCHPLELYSERRRWISFLEDNLSEDFDFYGVGWDCIRFTDSYMIGRFLNRLQIKRSLFGMSFKCYRGVVERKAPILRKYDFCLCYENVADSNGWVSEKIWDALFAGCIPIYRGARNVEKYIPPELFIDVRKFNGIKEIYRHVMGIDQSEISKRREMILEFLMSEQASEFSNEKFVKTIIANLKIEKC